VKHKLHFDNDIICMSLRRFLIIASILNHEIMEEFQKLGYPIFSQNTLPLDEDLLERLFGEEVRAGVITHALDITDAWKNSYSCSTNHKVWAAKLRRGIPTWWRWRFPASNAGRCADLRCSRRHYRTVRDTLFLL
jgi:predicted nucleotide-binding protein (sugar kinase/HSP70/actin superfamily)